MAEKYGQRPSTILGVQSNWLAFCFDEALFEMTISIENKVAKGKKLEDILGISRETGPSTRGEIKTLNPAIFKVMGAAIKFNEPKKRGSEKPADGK